MAQNQQRQPPEQGVPMSAQAEGQQQQPPLHQHREPGIQSLMNPQIDPR